MKKSNNINKKKDLFLIYGINGCKSVINSLTCKISLITLSDNFDINNFFNQKQYDALKSKIKIISGAKFNDIYKMQRTQGIVIQFNYNISNQLVVNDNYKNNECYVILDSIKDPQNLGQIIRTSECAGVKGIIIPERRSVKITNTVLQVSQGAFCNIDIVISKNIKYSINELKSNGFWVAGLENSIDSKNWCDTDFNGKIAFVFGSEGEGIRPVVKKYCDFLATIPMVGQTNSLNISASVSAILFERNRQLLQKK